jgi:hypothetical protein
MAIENNKKTAAANPAPMKGAAADGEIDTSNWEKEETGFAPYWTPAPGKKFLATPMGRDDRDPEFVRYQMRLEQAELECQSGPKDDPTPVIVKKGDTFTVSVYTQLDDKFNEYMESGIFPILQCIALKEVKTKTVGQTCWTFDLRVSPTDKQKILGFRKEKAMAAALAESERKAIQENV